MDYSGVNLDEIQLPSPVEADNESECPNTVIYSKVSRNIARRSSSDSEASIKEDLNVETSAFENGFSKMEPVIAATCDGLSNAPKLLQNPLSPKDEVQNLQEDSKEQNQEDLSRDENEEKLIKENDSNDIETKSQKEENLETLEENGTLEKPVYDRVDSEEKEECNEGKKDHEEEDKLVNNMEEETHEGIESEAQPKIEILPIQSEGSIDNELNEIKEKMCELITNISLQSKIEEAEEESECDEKHEQEEIISKDKCSPEKLTDDTLEGSELLNVSVASPRQEQVDKKSLAAEKECEKDTEGDVLELGCEEGDRDGLVDITDEEMSTYEKNWEMENDEAGDEKKVGLEGLETEAISECEDTLNDDTTSAGGKVAESVTKEEGEIVTEERVEPVAWKKLSKGTKERSYREKGEKESKKENKEKKKEKKPKEKRKELERYDVRKLIGDKPRKRKTDEFGRDISNSRSRSVSIKSDSRTQRKRSRDKKKRSYSRVRSRSRGRSRSRFRSRSKSRTRRRSRSRSRGRSRSRSRQRSWSRRRTRSRDRTRSRSRKRLRSRSLRREKRRGGRKNRSRKQRRQSSTSCSSCSCSSCERERRGAKNLTVIVPNKKNSTLKKKKDRKKDKGKDKGRKDKRRRPGSPIPSKEVFTSGDNILVSVNFKASRSGELNRTRDAAKRKRDDDARRKKDKGSKENQPLRSIVTTTVSVPPNMPKSKRRGRLSARNLKPVAIIDLDQSPFRELSPSPKEVIILSDSDNENKRTLVDSSIQPITTGPKTPPEPHIKFSISTKPPVIRSLTNPLLDTTETEEREVDDEEQEEMSHKGPNTPPEPPVPYDPFEPTKSRSPTPCVEMDTEEINPSPAPEINMCISRLTPEPPKPLSPPPKISQHDSPKTPSPLHSPPKPPEELLCDKPKPLVYTPAITTNCTDDVVDIGGGDSPYSPGTSEGDDLFEPPLPPITTPTPIAKVKPRPIQPQKHTNTLKLTPSPLKKRPLNNKLAPLKNNKGSMSKKEIGIKLDEDQLKILDELPNSAVEMQVKDKFLKKLNRQERVVEEVKLVLKPHYAKKHVTKEEYKDILRKAVPKICHNKSGEINPKKIQHLIEAYVKKYRHRRKKNISSMLPLTMLKPKPKPTMWC